MASTPLVSVCVSTRNRAHHLPNLFGHLERQTLAADRFEVVVVDDGSTDDTWSVLQRIASSTPLDVRPYRSERAGGAAAGRNRAWRAARAPWCAFTDDDCMPTPRWLEAALEVVDDRVVIGAGAVLPPPSEQSTIGPFSRLVLVVPENARWCATANLFVRRHDLDRVGGFDEVLLKVAGEDTDLALRVMARGVEFTYLEEAVVHHHVEQVGLRGLMRDHRRYLDLPAVFAKNPWARSVLLDHGLFWKRTHPLLLMLLGGVALSRRVPAAALLCLPWLHERACRQPIAESAAHRLVTLPAVLLLDLSEVVVMVRGSVRHRQVVL